MKEQEGNNTNELTNQPQINYSRGGDIFVGKGNMENKPEPEAEGGSINNGGTGGGGNTSGNSENESRESTESFSKKFFDLLKNEDVKAELKANVPDFTKEKLKPLRDFFQEVNPASSDGSFVYIADIMTQKAIKGLKDENKTEVPEVTISEESRRVMAEWLLERIISIPDANPDAPYGDRLNSLYISTNKAGLLEAIRRNLPEDNSYFGNLDHVRGTAHEFNRSLSLGESYKEFVTQHLRTHGLDFMQNELAGVSTVTQLYEKVATHRVSQSKEWFNKEDIDAIDKEVKQIFSDLIKKNDVKKTVWVKDKNGNKVKNYRSLMDWEGARALRIGKIFFAGDLRFALYSTLGDLPSDANTPGRIASPPYEYIARSLVPFKMIAARFQAAFPGPSKYMEHVFKEQENREKYLGLFGFDKRTIEMDTYGAPDPESHGWRSSMLFFGNIKFKQGKNEQGEDESIRIKAFYKDKNVVLSEKTKDKKVVLTEETASTLLDYLDEESKQLIGNLDDLVMGRKAPKEEEYETFSNAVKDVVLGQRLYLTALARYGNFHKSLRENIWQKIAIIKPSTIVSLCPEVVTNKEDWEKLRIKLYEAEMKRVLKDSEKMTLGEKDLKKERDDFKIISQLAEKKDLWTEKEYEQVLEYMGIKEDVLGTQGEEKDKKEKIIPWSPEEKRELESIIKKGFEVATMEKKEDKDKKGVKKGDKEGRISLAEAKMPATFAIDDAPVVSWKKTGDGLAGLADEDIIRLLIGDHKNYAEAWNEINDLVESPGKTGNTIEHFAKAVDGIGAVIGKKSAQDIIEPFITAWVKMASTKDGTLWVPGGRGIKRFIRRPTSEMEIFYRSLYQSMDENERRNFLQAVSQAGALRDNTAGTNPDTGLTQLEEVLKRTKSSRKWISIAALRTIIYLLGPVFTAELLKSIMPGELMGK